MGSEVVGVSIASIERVCLAGAGGGVVVPAGDRGSARCSRFVGEGAGVGLSGAASISGTIVVAVVVGWAGGGSSRGSSADDEVSVGIGESGSLDALWLASGVSTVVLALFVGLEVVGVSLTAGVDELLAVAGLGVEPPAIRVRSTVSLFSWQLAHVLRTWAADSAEGRRAGRGLAGVGGGAGVGAGAGWRAFHVAFAG